MELADFMNNNTYLKWANDGQKKVIFHNILNYISSSTDIQNHDVALLSCIQVIDQLMQDVESVIYKPPKRADGAINIPSYKKQLTEKLALGPIPILKGEHYLPYRFVFPFFFAFFKKDQCSEEMLDSLFSDAASFESQSWGDEINLLVHNFVYTNKDKNNIFLYRKNIFAYFDNTAIFDGFLSSLSKYITKKDDDKIDLTINTYKTDINDRKIMFSGIDNDGTRLDPIKKKDIINIINLTCYMSNAGFFNEKLLAGQDAALLFFDLDDTIKLENIKNLIRTYSTLNSTSSYNMSFPLIQLIYYSKSMNSANLENLKNFLNERADNPSVPGLFYYLNQPIIFNPENGSFKATDELTTKYIKSSTDVTSHTEALESILGASFFTTVIPPGLLE